MYDDQEIQETAESEREASGKHSWFDMDEAFCARMRMAIAAGLEHARIGVVTTPGTKNPRYVPAKPKPLAPSRRAVEHA